MAGRAQSRLKNARPSLCRWAERGTVLSLLKELRLPGARSRVPPLETISQEIRQLDCAKCVLGNYLPQPIVAALIYRFEGRVMMKVLQLGLLTPGTQTSCFSRTCTSRGILRGMSVFFEH